MDEWAEIRRLHRSERLPVKAIARKLGISKNTVKKALRAEEVPRYQRAPKGSIVDAAEPFIRWKGVNFQTVLTGGGAVFRKSSPDMGPGL